MFKESIFSVTYTLAINKIKRPIMIPPITKENGTQTTSLKEFVLYIISHLFKENEEEYSEFQKQIIRNLANQPDSGDNPQFTQVEIERIINNLQHKTTPGPDKLTTQFTQISRMFKT